MEGQQPPRAHTPQPQHTHNGQRNPWTKRWRVKAHAQAFLMEPSIAYFDDPLNQRESANADKDSLTALSRKGTPQLIIYRDKSDVIQIPHAASHHQEKLGPLQCVIQVDALLGVITIRASRFLVVVVGADAVASLPPDCSPIGVTTEADVQSALEKCAKLYPPHRNIYAIHSVLLIPFHIPTDLYLSIKINRDLVTARHAGARARAASGEPISKASRRQKSLGSHLRQTEPESGSKSTGKHRQAERGYEGRSMDSLLGEVAPLVVDIEKTLSKRTFFFSYDVDLTRSLQSQWSMWKEKGILALPQAVPTWSSLYGDRDRHHRPPLLELSQDRFIWNKGLVTPFEESGIDLNWLVPCIQGCVTSIVTNLGRYLLRMLLIGRRSAYRGGTRYFSRGINEDGDVANFCETESLFCLYEAAEDSSSFPATSLPQKGGGWTSYLQVRGSVPLFWEQNTIGLNPQPRITNTLEASQKAFIKHQRRLESEYGSIYYLDLLSTTKQGESKISEGLQQILKCQRSAQGIDLLKDASLCEACNFNYVSWDFHKLVQAKGFEDALDSLSTHTEINKALDEIGYFHVIGPRVQKGVIRTNCLDCLDRTNVLQWYLGQRLLYGYLNEHQRSNIVNIRGVKYSQDTYAWLVRSSDEPDLINSFVLASRLRNVETPSGWPRRTNPAWNFEGPLSLPPPTPDSAARANIALFDPPDRCGPSQEYRTYFVGGFTHDNIETTYFRAAIQSSDGQEGEQQVQLWGSAGDTAADGDQGPQVGVPISAPIQQTPDDALLGSLPTTYVLKDGYSTMWADMGDLISVAYTGTGSVLTPMMKSGKSTLLTNLTHWKRSVGRLYKHNFEDKGRQECFDLILGTHHLSARSSRSLTRVKSDPEYMMAHTHAWSLDLWIGTWNTGGGSSLAAEDLTDWLKPSEPHPKGDPDLYCVCLQEIVELTSLGTMLNQVNRTRENEAIQAVKRSLGDEYILASAKTMVGIELIIFVKKALKSDMRDIELAELRMGYMGQIGNKGGVLCRFEFRNKTFCFVAAHFAPDKNYDKSAERVGQFDRVLSLRFPLCNQAARDHDFLFLGGDFNFPTMANMTEIETWLQNRNFDEFFERDQLTWLRAKTKGLLLEELLEAPILFWPTFKYRTGTSNYDRKRPPSWCDRVMWGGRSILSGEASLQVRKYDRVRSIISSDHKPVFFTCQLRSGRDLDPSPPCGIVLSPEDCPITLIDL